MDDWRTKARATAALSNPSHPRWRNSSRCATRRSGMSIPTTDRLSPAVGGVGDVTIHREVAWVSGVLALRTRTRMPDGSYCELPNRSSGQGQMAASTRVSARNSTRSPRRAATGHDRSVPHRSTSLGSHRLSGSCTRAGSPPDAAIAAARRSWQLACSASPARSSYSNALHAGKLRS